MTIEKASVVGGGIIGRSWAVVFARAGVPFTDYDNLPNTVVDAIAMAVTEANVIHACIDEKLDSKHAIFVELDRLTKTSAILATTTSSFPVSTFASELPGRSRCIVVHPATPPHLLP